MSVLAPTSPYSDVAVNAERTIFPQDQEQSTEQITLPKETGREPQEPSTASNPSGATVDLPEDKPNPVSSSILTFRTQDGSFWTATGTIRSDFGQGEEERSVILSIPKQSSMLIPETSASHPRDIDGWTIKADSTLSTIPDILIFPPGTSASTFTTASLNQGSLILRLVPPTQLTYADLPPDHPLYPVMHMLRKWSPDKILENTGAAVEKAFWRMVMPSVSGIVGWSESLANVIANLAEPLSERLSSLVPVDFGYLLGNESLPTGSHTPLPNRLAESREHLYADETIYTLRLPSDTLEALRAGADISDKADCGEGSSLTNIGPTARPIFIRKRAALPQWGEKNFDNLAWGKSFATAGMGGGLDGLRM